MSWIWQDLRYGLRMLAKSPGFTAVAILTLGLAIGANITIFSFADALFFRPLPARDPYRLISAGTSVNGRPAWGFSYPEYAYFRDHGKSFTELAAHYSASPLNVRAHGDAREEAGAVVTANLFPLLGIQPYVGRFFAPEEDRVPDRDAVAVVSYGYWLSRLGGDPGVVGRQVLINGTSFTIVGVTPEYFHGVLQGTDTAIYIPAAMIHVGYRWSDCFQPGCHALSLLGRLGPDQTPATAQTELTGLFNQFQSNYAVSDSRRGVMVAPALGFILIGGRVGMADEIRLLSSVAGLLLLIACANLIGLRLAKGATRQKEMAVRLAVGASRSRLVCQLFIENLLLVIPGGSLGLLISLWAKTQLVSYYTMGDEGHVGFYNLSLDPLVIAYSIGIAILAGVLFGLAPAILSLRHEVNLVLQGSSNAGARTSLLRNILVVGQVALSLGLLISASLLLKSEAEIRSGANFEPNHVALMRLRPLLVNYSPEKAQAFTREVVRRLAAQAGVESVSLAKGEGYVWHSSEDIDLRLPGQEFSKIEQLPRSEYQEVAPRYFETLKIPLIEGREFTMEDRPGSPRVTIVNETLARRFWPGQSALGRYLLIHDQSYQIVGITKDALLRSAIDPASSVLYLAFWQNDIEPQVDTRFCVRVKGNVSGMIPVLHHAVESVDANVPISEEMPLTEQVEGEYWYVYLTSSVLVCSAAMAFFLSAIGLYAVLAFAVRQRTREIGIRMALGAQRAEVMRMVMMEGLRVAAFGVSLGVIAALAMTHALAHFIFGVSTSDPRTFIGVIILIVAVAALASFIPARRAMQVDPMVSLRYE